jgi:uncharacterized protein YbaP (TraB family)
MKQIDIFIKQISLNILTLLALAGANSCAEARQQNFETSDKFSLLWEITGNGIQKPSYLFGTIHIYDSSIFKIPDEVYTAIDLCDNFAMEIDVNQIDQSKLLQQIMITDPDSTLDKLLEPEIYNEIQKIPFFRIMGDMANQMKPFYIQQYILIENPLTLQSVELNLNSHANSKSKNITGIETVDEQLEAIDSMPLSEQAQGIIDIYNYCKREHLEFAEAGQKLFNTIQITYKEQDFDKLVHLEDEFKMTTNSSASDSTLIGSRNINMANRIDEFIKQNKTLFVAVGSLHLPDYNSLRGIVALLKEKGYNLRPILIELTN